MPSGRVISLPSRLTIQALDEAPSVTWPCASTSQASRAPCSRAACLASTFGSSATDLMSTRCQRMIGHGDDGDAVGRQLFKPGEIVAARGHHHGRRRISRRKRKIAPRHAAA